MPSRSQHGGFLLTAAFLSAAHHRPMVICGRNRRRLFQPQLGRPLFPNLVAFLGAEVIGDGEFVAPVKRFGGIDEHAAHGKVAAPRTRQFEL